MHSSQTTRSTARRLLWGANALIGAGILAYLGHCTTQASPAPRTPPPATNPAYVAPTAQQTPAVIEPRATAIPAPIAPAQATPTLLIPGYDAYNALVPTIEEVAAREGVPADILALIVLTETKGKGGTRHEPAFEKRYVQPVLTGARDKTHKPLRLTLETMLAQQQASGADRDSFASRLATSYGPTQIMYLVAVERGFRGTAEQLADPATNLALAAKRIKAHAASTSTPDPATPDQRIYDWTRVLIDYNSGSANGTPHPGYIERARLYRQKLGL